MRKVDIHNVIAPIAAQMILHPMDEGGTEEDVYVLLITVIAAVSELLRKRTGKVMNAEGLVAEVEDRIKELQEKDRQKEIQKNA